MTPSYLALDCRAHLCSRFRFAFRPQTPRDVVELGFGEIGGGTERAPSLSAGNPGGSHQKDSSKMMAHR